MKNRRPIKDMIQMFRDGSTMQQIGKHYGISRQAVWKRLKKAGIQTSGAGRKDVKCHVCGKQFQTHRSRWRESDNHYCDMLCYRAKQRSRQNNSLALIKLGLPTDQGIIVHYINKDRNDLLTDNLRVFKNVVEYAEWLRSQTV